MTGPLADVDIAILLAFGCGALVAVWAVVIVAGFVPVRGEAGPLRLPLIAVAAAATALLVIALAVTAPLLPTAVAILATGLAILGGPFLVQPIPDRLRDSPAALVATMALALGAMALLPWPL